MKGRVTAGHQGRLNATRFERRSLWIDAPRLVPFHFRIIPSSILKWNRASSRNGGNFPLGSSSKVGHASVSLPAEHRRVYI